MHSYKGLFISFEGIEGCGKSTHVPLLEEYLKQLGHEVVISREPGGLESTEIIRDLLLNPKWKEEIYQPITELFLFEASRSVFVEKKVRPVLKRGGIFIADRFADSSTAYQGFAGKISGETVAHLNEIATMGLMPDITLILDLELEDALNRSSHHEYKKKDRMEQKPIDFHDDVQRGYRWIAQMFPNRAKLIYTGNKRTKEQTQAEIRTYVDEALVKKYGKI